MKHMKCERCRGYLIPNYFKSEFTRQTMISGLTCNNCFKNVITSDMTIDEYTKVVKDFEKHKSNNC